MPGTALGPYRLDRELGSGGMGKVYEAVVEGRAPGLAVGTRVAVKVVHPHLLETPGSFRRFLREAEVGKAVAHENVVRTYDCDEIVVAGVRHRFLVMEYVEGQTLRSLLAELDRVPEELCRHIGREVAKGLAAIHAAGVVHRDLKPENVLITADRHTVKVMDLGVARLADEAVRLSQSGTFVGSVEYAAPEQFGRRSPDAPGSAEGGGSRARGDGFDVGPAADLHALGVVLYELATAQHPYRADDFRGVMRRVLDERPRRPAEIAPQISPFLEELLLQLLEKDPERRIASAAELARILDEGERSSWWREKERSIRTATRRPLRRIRIPRETALHGRDEELARLRALWEQVKAGEGQALLVEGEAGIGKSRLLDEFVGLLQREGEDVNFLFGGYPPGGAATAAGAFSTAYREHFGGESLDETLPAYLAGTPLLVPAFAALLRGDATPAGAEPLTRESLQTVFVEVTRAVARERPTIVVVDDLHLAPPEGRALFAAVAMAARGGRVLLAGTARPEVDPNWLAALDRIGVRRLALRRLGPKDLVRLLTESLRSEQLATEISGQIALRSDGNPYFVFEILRGLREGKFLTRRPDGTWAGTHVAAEIEVPTSIHDLVAARIADLDDEDREVLDVAACCGFDFDPLVVAAVLAVPQVALMRRLARIERRHRLVRAVGRRYEFDHHQVADTLRRAMPPLLSEPYHAAIAEALESGHGAAGTDPAALDGALCADLADHFLAGKRGPRALRYLDAALAHLEYGYLNHAAAELAGRALAVPGLLDGRRRIEVLLRRASRLDLLGRRDEQRAALDEALELAERDGDPAERCRVRRALGRLLQHLMDHAGARSHAEEALALARACGDRGAEAEITDNLGVMLRTMGRAEEAREQCARAVGIYREIGDRRGEALSTGNLGAALTALRRLDEAQRSYERAAALCRDVGNRHGESIATGNLGAVLSLQGRVVEARVHYERHLAISREVGSRTGQVHALWHLGNASLAAGELEAAAERGQESRDLARETGDRRMEAWGAFLLAEVAEERGAPGEAAELVREAIAIAREASLGELLPSALLLLGSLCAGRGEEVEARGHLAEALRLADERQRPDERVLPLCVLAALDPAGVAPALDALTSHEARLSAATRSEARFLLWRATGAHGHLAEARRLLDASLAALPPEARAAALANRHVNREIAAAAAAAGL